MSHRPSRLRHVLIALILWAGRVVAGEGARFNYPQLDLSDGRSLHQVSVRSYDAATDQLLLFADGKLMLVPLKLVGPPLHDQLKAGVPKGGETTSVVDDVRQAAPTSPVSAPAPVVVAADNQQAVLAQHGQLALERAKDYYRYEFPAGSGATRLTASNFEMKRPQAVPGWSGRYRTTGRAFLEFFDSRGYSFNKTTSRFEVITEAAPDGSLSVIDFTQK